MSYLDLLALGAARRVLAALVAAWVSYGAVTLAVLLSVVDGTGSYASAGLAVAAFSVDSGALAPVRGRLVDRLGGRRTLPPLALGYAGSLAALALLRGSAWGAAAAALAAGASAPPLVAATRGVWGVVVPEQALRRAYTLTSVVGDVALVGGPPLAAALTLASPLLALGLCGGAALAAALLLAPLAPRREPASGRLVAAPGFAALLAVSVALGWALGLVEVAVPAAASRWDAAALSGALLACFAAGSVVGGLWFGNRRWRARADRRYLLSVALLALAVAPAAAASSPAALAPVLMLAGLAYGPATVSLFESLDLLAPAAATEGLTWVTTAEAAGSAAGAAVAGVLASRLWPGTPFLLAAGVLAAAALAALAAARR